MIIQEFDNGWDAGYPAKQFEKSIMECMLSLIRDDNSRTVIINSVWYSKEFHDHVMSWCQKNSPDHLILVAMLDPAIPQPDMYRDLNVHCITLGYYPGAWHVDFWALFVDKFFQLPSDKELLCVENLELPFMSLNRKPHWHRLQLYSRLQQINLLDKGLVSMGGNTGTAHQALAIDSGINDLAPNSDPGQYGIHNDIASLGHLANWQRCFLNVVTETVYDINHNYFVSEKIYKPIVGCRPFLVYDPDGGRRWLEDRGFETYIDDFNDITDLDLSISGNMAPFLKALSQQHQSYFRKKFLDLKGKILYNKNQFRVLVDNNKNLTQKGIACLT